MREGLDFIGDVHGKADLLAALLSRLGYRNTAGAWRHPRRTAVFVGDLIDRGPQQLATVEMVQRMHAEGAALAVLGNHEHNALGWELPDERHPGEFLRRHTPAQRMQHQAFLDEALVNPQAAQRARAWFATLPVLLEIQGVRVAHACWDDRHAATVLAAQGEKGHFDERALRESLTPGTALHRACEIVTKGPEVKLPVHLAYEDHHGKSREEVRWAWWRSHGDLGDCALPMPGLDVQRLQGVEVPAHARPVVCPRTPHFFGHYWMRGRPRVLGPNIASVDYQAEGAPVLTAYRWNGEQQLQDNSFVQVGAA